MKESTISSLAKTLSAHAVTALITLTVVFVMSGGRLSGRLSTCSDITTKA